ncbi:hypothetical protein BDP27DRAFT_1228238 [Rhodocollybia butyracea]|uniref:Uncharacterized protein n=1 Tax=Rhodocollybia butyracea TaxID=206335 RepID=A0A9P5U4T6_9AGAR|nr:hypothetical protein BDP27DRAFT_1228238 [Rhodocollybia butyracea]
MSTVINYAQLFGWNSVPAAAVFAAVYSLLAAFFLFKIIRERRYVLFIMTSFCLIRLTAFIMRAISAGVSSVGENEGIFIGAEVLFSVGFFGLLYGTYILVVDRLELCDNTNIPIPIIGTILNLVRNRRVFRICLVICVALGITGIDITSANLTSTVGTDLRKASAIIFLVLTIIQVLQTLVLIAAEHRDKDSLKYTSTSFGAKHAPLLFGVIALMLLIREIFSVATLNQFSKANNEHFWYPLVAVPELICVLVYAIPGVIPPKVPPKVTETTDLPMYTK